MNKKTALLLFGGESPEHDVSLNSAKNVFDALDKDKYHIELICISKEGIWRYVDSVREATEGDDLITISLGEKKFITENKDIKPDVLLPILHGENGEDGAPQALAKLLHIPMAGPSLMGAVIAMDKDITKKLLTIAELPVVDWVVVKKSFHLPSYKAICEHVKSEKLFVKPAGTGSSVGVTKVHDESEFESAMQTAFSYDNKVIIEAAIEDARELEVAVIGNDKPQATLPGEVIPGEEFYSYEDKYSDTSEASVKIPADISQKIAQEVRQLALNAYRATEGHGMARIDFFLKDSGDIYINEINTIPGFTNISMYPKLWDHEGVRYSALLDKLIEYALAN